MIRVETATAKDFGQVLPLLRQFNVNNPNISTEKWRLLFDYPWPTNERQRGFVLRDGDRTVGFLGTILYERQIDGRPVKFCNLSSWVTLPEYRNQSLLLFKKVQEETERTVTCVSPSKAVYPLYIRCGFRDLETKLRILYPFPSLSRTKQWLSCSVTTNPGRIAGELNSNHAPLLEHHRNIHCGHLLVRTRRGYCYIVFTRTRGRRASFAHVHYISDAAIFLENLDRVKLRLFLACGTPFVMIDSRFVAGLEIPHSKEVVLSGRHVFRSPTLRAEQIDNLYSELILLNL